MLGVAQTRGFLTENPIVNCYKSLIYWGRDLNSRPPDPQSPGFIPDSANLTKRQGVETSQQFNKLFFNTIGKSGGRSCLIMFLIALFISVPSITQAGWSRNDTGREAVYTLVHVIDWGQTLDIAKNPDKYHEHNIILGRHPSVGGVNRYMTALSLAHLGISMALPSEYRAGWQWITIIVTVGIIGHNHHVGLRINF